MSDLRERHLDRHAGQAAKAFSRHVITKRGDDHRRWLLQRLYPDGKPDWTFAAEVIVLEGGGLFVGGDIDHVVFSWGPPDPVARLRWMGECRDLDYYVRQKARIGTRDRQCVDVWESSVACEELKQHVADYDDALKDEEALQDALRADTQQDFLDSAYKALGGDACDAWDVVHDMGEVLAAPVIYAHAALARLCALLREEETTTTQEAAHG